MASASDEERAPAQGAQEARETQGVTSMARTPAPAARHHAAPSPWTTGSCPAEGLSELFNEIAAYLAFRPGDPQCGSDEPGTTSAWGGDPKGIRILLPYSGSEAADRAVAAMLGLAQSLRAEVRVLHVREYDTCRGARFFLETKGEGAALVHAAVSRLRRRGVAATGIVRDARRGCAADAVVDEAARSNASMVLVGAHRRRWPADFVRPNVVRRVLRRAPCAVLVVRTDPPPSNARDGERRRHHPEGPRLPHAA